MSSPGDDATPRNVEVDASGITVWRLLTGSELAGNALHLTAIAAVLGFWFVPGVAPAVVSWVGIETAAEIMAPLVMGAPFFVLIELLWIWRFLTQPVLRLTSHEVQVIPRWSRWTRWGGQRFALSETLVLHGNVEPWGGGHAVDSEEELWSVITLGDGKKKARFRRRVARGPDDEVARRELEWILARLKATWRRRREEAQQSAGDDLESALAPLLEQAGLEPAERRRDPPEVA